MVKSVKPATSEHLPGNIDELEKLPRLVMPPVSFKGWLKMEGNDYKMVLDFTELVVIEFAMGVKLGIRGRANADGQTEEALLYMTGENTVAWFDAKYAYQGCMRRALCQTDHHPTEEVVAEELVRVRSGNLSKYTVGRDQEITCPKTVPTGSLILSGPEGEQVGRGFFFYKVDSVEVPDALFSPELVERMFSKSRVVM